MPGDLRFGLRLDLGVPTYDSLSELAKLADQTGYDAVWLRDHVSLETATGQPNSIECWTAMAALARDTSRVRIGSLVLATPFRNPALLAKMASTLALISGNRLVLGIGAGNIPDEFEEYGYEFPSPGDRVRMLAEAATIIRRMWSERRPSFTGRHYRIANALNEPKPPPPPLLIGASGHRSLGVVARHADYWNIADSLDGYYRAREVLRQRCTEIDRDPDSIRHFVTIYLIPDRDEAEAKRRHAAEIERRPGLNYLRNWTMAGAPAQLIERLRPLVDLGVRDFVVFFVEKDRQAENVALFAEEIRNTFPIARNERSTR